MSRVRDYELDTDMMFVEDIYPMQLARKLAREDRRKKSRRKFDHEDDERRSHERHDRRFRTN